MRFEQKSNLQEAIIKIALIESVFIMLGIGFYLFAETLTYLVAAICVGAAVSIPMFFIAIRQSQEDTDAGR